jgi:hypothetical protein
MHHGPNTQSVVDDQQNSLVIHTGLLAYRRSDGIAAIPDALP